MSVAWSKSKRRAEPVDAEPGAPTGSSRASLARLSYEDQLASVRPPPLRSPMLPFAAPSGEVVQKKDDEKKGTPEDLDKLLTEFQYADRDPAKRKSLLKEIEKLAGQLGQLTPEQDAKIQKAKYLASDAYAQAGKEDGDGVRVWGTSTDLKDLSPGHVMATSGDEHFSFAPPGKQGDADEKTRLRGVTKDDKAPFPGAPKFGGQPIAEGAYLRGKDDKHKQESPPEAATYISHKFDKRFIPPAQFEDLSAQIRTSDDAKNKAVRYLVRTSKFDPTQLAAKGGSIQPTPDGKKQVVFTDGTKLPLSGEGADATLQAVNCGTELMKLFTKVMSSNGKRVLEPADLTMLGFIDGAFIYGLDMRPQDLYEHLRWKETVYLKSIGAGG